MNCHQGLLCVEEEEEAMMEDEQCAQLYQEKDKQGTMYGMLLESIQHFIQEVYSEEAWSAILQHAQCKNMEFTTHKRYKDEIMLNLAQSCSHILKDKTKDEFMLFFGQCFVKFFSHYGYDKILLVSGRHYRDFLNGIDNLHETMRFSYPKLQSPSFYVAEEDRNGCVLHYRSKRNGFTYYVVGQLKQCAKKFYSLDVEVSVLKDEQTDKGCHVVYRLDFDNQSAFASKNDTTTTSGLTDFLDISGELFFKVFPFSIVFNKKMVITHAGDNLSHLFGSERFVGEPIACKFGLRRPQMEFTWENVFCLQTVVFEVESLGCVKRSGTQHPSCECLHGEGSEVSKTILLKGQMKFMESCDSMAFLCSPLLGNLDEMHTVGLYINDLHMHDNSRDMALTGWQHASRLEYSIEKQIAKSRLIADNLKMLDEWKDRSDSLLYSMIPKSIAIRLKNGQDPITTCEMFDQVTIMFSYLIGFTDICARVTAMEVVECINTVFTLFDSIVDKYDTFKVETLGDAVYMVAGGVPDRKPNHAQNVAGLALELLQKVTTLPDPSMVNEQLAVRIGMHTGNVVAGVVGKRMPQYCLFGDTVNTASRMETHSKPGRIHISEPCHKCLEGTEFVTVFRGKVNVKGKGEMKTYWLAGQSTDELLEEVILELQQESLQPVCAAISDHPYDHYESSQLKAIQEGLGITISPSNSPPETRETTPTTREFTDINTDASDVAAARKSSVDLTPPPSPTVPRLSLHRNGCVDAVVQAGPPMFAAFFEGAMADPSSSVPLGTMMRYTVQEEMICSIPHKNGLRTDSMVQVLIMSQRTSPVQLHLSESTGALPQFTYTHVKHNKDIDDDYFEMQRPSSGPNFKNSDWQLQFEMKDDVDDYLTSQFAVRRVSDVSAPGLAGVRWSLMTDQEAERAKSMPYDHCPYVAKRPRSNSNRFGPDVTDLCLHERLLKQATRPRECQSSEELHNHGQSSNSWPNFTRKAGEQEHDQESSEPETFQCGSAPTESSTRWLGDLLTPTTYLSRLVPGVNGTTTHPTPIASNQGSPDSDEPDGMADDASFLNCPFFGASQLECTQWNDNVNSVDVDMVGEGMLLDSNHNGGSEQLPIVCASMSEQDQQGMCESSARTTEMQPPETYLGINCSENDKVSKCDPSHLIGNNLTFKLRKVPSNLECAMDSVSNFLDHHQGDVNGSEKISLAEVRVSNGIEDVMDTEV